MKAYKIETIVDAGFAIYLAESAGAAKTLAVNGMQDAYRDATYSWIVSCRRAPEFDYLAHTGSGCIAWQSNEGEHWQIDRGHWWHGGDVAPNTACTRTAVEAGEEITAEDEAPYFAEEHY